MGNVTLPVGDTDAKVVEWLTAFFKRERESLERVRAAPELSKEDKDAKERATITQASLARAINMSESRMSRRMSGQLPWSTYDLDYIARVLGVSPLEIQSGQLRE